MSSLFKIKITELLAKNKLSAAALEKKAGLKEGAVSNILKDKSLNPSFNTISAIAQTLECSLYDFNDKTRTNNISDKTLPDNFQWNYIVFLDTLKTVQNFIEKYKLNIDFKNVLLIIKESYIYSLKKDNKSLLVDKNFVEWLVKNSSNL